MSAVYLQFCLAHEFPVELLIDSSSKVNTIQPSSVWKPSLCICIPNISAEKIDSNRLETYEMIIALF